MRKLLKGMARPGGLELPTFWFVVESREILNALFGVAYPENHSILSPSVGLLGQPEGNSMAKKIKPSELEAEAKRLIREGKMPTLDCWPLLRRPGRNRRPDFGCPKTTESGAPMSRVSYKLPDFTGPDGTEFSDIEVIVESDLDVRETANLTSVVETNFDRADISRQTNSLETFRTPGLPVPLTPI